MSERQSRIKRKNEASEIKTSKKKISKLNVLSNCIIVAVVAAMLGAGGWAVYSKYSEMAANNAVNSEQAVPTVAEYAATLEMTAEDFLAEYGLAGNENVTAETDIAAAMQYMTLTNYAKMSGVETAEIRESMGISEEFGDDALMSDIFASMETQMTAEGETTEEPKAEPAE